MLELKLTHKNTYAEIGQANPMRWRLLHKRKGVFYSQSGLIKCKDFFNDVVAWKRAKQKFSIYSFSNKVKFNRDGMYFHLTSISNDLLFKHNLDVLNTRIKEDLGVEISYFKHTDTSAVICIPHKLWKNTYYISLVSMMIRLCNYDKQYETWGDFFDEKAPLCTIETAFSKKTREYTKENGFKIPANLRKFWFWAGKDYHSGNQVKPMGSVIHNNGVNNWVQFLGV